MTTTLEDRIADLDRRLTYVERIDIYGIKEIVEGNRNKLLALNSKVDNLAVQCTQMNAKLDQLISKQP